MHYEVGGPCLARDLKVLARQQVTVEAETELHGLTSAFAKLDGFESRGKEMVQCKRNQVSTTANPEQDGITGSDVVLLGKMIEKPSSQNREDKATRRAGH